MCLLIAAFSPLTFKAIIDRYVFTAILNLVFPLILCFFFVPFSFLWFGGFLPSCLCSLLFGSCDSVVCFSELEEGAAVIAHKVGDQVRLSQGYRA